MKINAGDKSGSLVHIILCLLKPNVAIYTRWDVGLSTYKFLSKYYTQVLNEILNGITKPNGIKLSQQSAPEHSFLNDFWFSDDPLQTRLSRYYGFFFFLLPSYESYT